ncbi:MAG: hypothetical protein AAGE01_23935 [Pseudomonadota bacterium]
MPTAASVGISRWHVTSRVIAAAIPGFILANTVSILFGFIMPGSTADGAAWGTIMAYAFYTCIIIWVFSVKRLRTVWLGLSGGIALTSAGAWGLYLLGASA